MIDKLNKIKMLVLDVDGIMTDCRIFLDTNGEWKRFFNIRDGAGIKFLIEKGYTLAVITGSSGNDIKKRVEVLGIHHIYSNSLDKYPALLDLQKKTGFSFEQIAYMGDDVFDIPVLEKIGFAATVPEAVQNIKKSCHYITEKAGGHGAVREVCDLILQHGSL